MITNGAERRANTSKSFQDRVTVLVIAVAVVLITSYIVYSAWAINTNTQYLAHLSHVSATRTGTFASIIASLKEICQAVGCKVVVVTKGH